MSLQSLRRSNKLLKERYKKLEAKLHALQAGVVSVHKQKHESEILIRREIIIAFAARSFHTTRERILAPSGSPGARQENVVRARQFAMTAIRDTENISLSLLGNLFGGRDHGTVVCAIRRIRDFVAQKAPLNGSRNGPTFGDLMVKMHLMFQDVNPK